MIPMKFFKLSLWCTFKKIIAQKQNVIITSCNKNNLDKINSVSFKSYILGIIFWNTLKNK